MIEISREDRITNSIAKTYCELYDINWGGTTEELFLLFDIEEFRNFHLNNYRILTELHP